MRVNLQEIGIDGIYLSVDGELYTDKNRFLGYDISGHKLVNRSNILKKCLTLCDDTYYKFATTVNLSNLDLGVVSNIICIKNSKIILIDTDSFEYIKKLNNLGMYINFIDEIRHLSVKDKLKLLSFFGYSVNISGIDAVYMLSGKLINANGELITKLYDKRVYITTNRNIGVCSYTVGYLIDIKNNNIHFYIKTSIERKFGIYKYRLLIDILNNKIIIIRTLNNLYMGFTYISNINFSYLSINFFNVSANGIKVDLGCDSYNLGLVDEIDWGV